MTLPAALTVICLGLVLLALSVMAIRAQIALYWWNRYCATVGGENAARIIVQERERSDREIDSMIARGMKHMDKLERDVNEALDRKLARKVIPFPRIVSGKRETRFDSPPENAA